LEGFRQDPLKQRKVQREEVAKLKAKHQEEKGFTSRLGKTFGSDCPAGK
jgi:hypothetical protein